LYFEAIPAQSPEREAADARLATAERDYEEGLRLFSEAQAYEQAGQHEEAEKKRDAVSSAFERGLTLAPMRPRLLFRLAEAYEIAGNYPGAAKFYRRAAMLSPDETSRREELCKTSLPSVVDDLFSSDAPPAPVVSEPPPALPLWPFYVGAALSFAALGLGLWAFRSRQKGRFTLEAFAARVPEAGPELAREISCIRHELIKHRLGLAPALVQNGSQDEVREFVRARLGGDLLGDFARHVSALQRIASERLTPPHEDPLLAPLARAVARAAKTSQALARDPHSKRAARDLDGLREDLLSADHSLARLVTSLGQTALDAAFLRDAAASVRQEPRIESLPLDAVTYAEVTPAPLVSIPRVDLLIVVKNLVRNALLALSHAKGRRLLSLEVALLVEPTGEESALLRIRDSAPGQPQLASPKAGSGLWIVQKTLLRYDGAVSVEAEPKGSPFTKAVVVRLFRAL
jgi:tetratricopeptide (TPR) repeat protein